MARLATRERFPELLAHVAPRTCFNTSLFFCISEIALLRVSSSRSLSFGMGFSAARAACPLGQVMTQGHMQSKSIGGHAAVKQWSEHAFEDACERARGSASSTRRALRRAAMCVLRECYRVDL